MNRSRYHWTAATDASLSMADAQALLKGYEAELSVAVSNSPKMTVIAGAPEALAQVLAKLEAKGVFWRRVKVDVASHSPQVDGLLEELTAQLGDVKPKKLGVAFEGSRIGHGALRR